MVLVHKKRDSTDMKKYKSVGLISNVHKFFPKILTLRLTRVLDENQVIAQASNLLLRIFYH